MLESGTVSKVHFKSLNELRFLAAFAVVIHHIERNKEILHIPSLMKGPWRYFMVYLGENGVGFFFVLSGFLMTFLLLKENQASGNIHIKAFYFRRILRIWPLYFFILITAFCLLPVLPGIVPMPPSYTGLIDKQLLNYAPLLLLFIFMMPNVALCLYAPVLGASHTWSIGVEEQFYLIWPVIMKKFLRRLMKVLLLFLIIKLLFQGLLFLWQEETGKIPVQLIYRFVKSFKIENMIIGGLGACVVFYDLARIKAFIFSRVVQLANLALILFILFFKTENRALYVVIEPLAFTILMLNLALNERSILNLKNKVMDELGKISYGIYMYHPIIIYIALSFLIQMPFTSGNGLVFNLALYSVVLVGTLAISFLSYRFLELPFILLKDKYAYVKSKP